MIKCSQCQKTSNPGQRTYEVVLETREKTYYQKTETGRLEAVGQGVETVRAARICLICYLKRQNTIESERRAQEALAHAREKAARRRVAQGFKEGLSPENPLPPVIAEPRKYTPANEEQAAGRMPRLPAVLAILALAGALPILDKE